MMTRYACRLNGIDLSSIDPEIYVLDVSTVSPVRDLVTTPLAGRSGQRITKRTTNSLSVEVKFEIHEQNTVRRALIAEKVTEWAILGGVLTTNDRPERRLHVICETLPNFSALRWTNSLTATFTAFEIPFWESEYPRNATVDGNGEAQMIAPGFADDSRVWASVTNAGTGAITSVDLTAGQTALHFSGLVLPSGSALEVGTDEHGVFYARIGSKSVLSKRTAESSDELRLEAGKFGKLSVSTDGKAKTRFGVRGYYT
jgi:hypothetical protein